jgi:hypothetical protein
MVSFKVLYSHRGRARSTWIISNGNNITTVRAVLRSIDVRTGMYSYQVILNDKPQFVVEVPGPESLPKKVFEALKGAKW